MEQQVEERAPLGVFVTLGRKGLSVDIPPEDFGYEMKPYGSGTEEHRLVYYDPTSRRPISLKPVNFIGGVQMPVYDARVLDCLRRHPENQANGGSGFMELPEQAVDFDPYSMTAVVPQGGINDGDVEDILKLQDLCSKAQLPPNAVRSMLERADRVAMRFQVQNYVAPREGAKLRSIQGRITDLMSALEEIGAVVEANSRAKSKPQVDHAKDEP